jgi:hypothetical protein
MALADMDPREVAKAQVKALAPAPAPPTPAEPVPAAPPSLLAARQRQAARVREATVARWLRRLSA